MFNNATILGATCTLGGLGGQFDVQHLAKGHFDTLTAAVGDQTTVPPIDHLSHGASHLLSVTIQSFLSLCHSFCPELIL